MVDTGKTGQLSLLVLRVGTQYYGLPVMDVVEVAAMVALDQLPDSPPALLGIANRHGAALPVLDLRVIFAQPQTPINSASLFVVVTYDTSMFALVADEILQVQHLDASTQSCAVAGRYIQHILGRTDRLIHVIALGALLADFIPDALPGQPGESTTTTDG